VFYSQLGLGYTFTI